WREAVAPDGRAYYYHAATKATSWTRPVAADASVELPPLPEGWKEARAPDGRTYYHHTVSKETSWKRPQLE
ncbi:hypothetical protein EMIHUDRAFT_49843, partial [Emiliania huxleyi CCMP1516]|uniref:WW domain-containing protein n=2 Tax=Emiliania huxleyi TaxID=2903 RepID=A0A0D3J3E9_EMIH1